MLQKILLLYAFMVTISFAEDPLNVSPLPVIAGSSPNSTSSPISSAAHTTPIPTTISTTSHSTSPPTNSTTPTSQPTSTSSTPAPEPSSTLAPPQKGHFIIHVLPNDTCLIADFAIQVTVKLENNSFSFDLPADVPTVNGSCSNTTDELNLSWVDDLVKIDSLSFSFKKNESASKYMVSQISLVINFQNVSTTFKTTEEKFVTSVSKSYKCDKEQEIKLEEEPNTNNNTFAVLKISKVQLQAFHISEDDKFSAAEDCAESSSTDIVPIAVGCALVVLIVIVLIAYLLGRRRSQSRGYLSM